MLTPDLQHKVDKAIRLLQAFDKPDTPIEIAYSGGKDSDAILQLAKDAGIHYRAIYKNTTIDPPGTIKHVQEMGVEILRPRQTFFQLIAKKGFPSRRKRFCCEILKEYKVLDVVVIGVRKEESRARKERYAEPTQCRGTGSNHVEQVLPILDWTTEDVSEYLKERKVKCAPVYYDEEGRFHPERRLGCMCCPLQSYKKRIAELEAHPGMVKAYIRAGKQFLDSHPDSKMGKEHKGNPYRFFCRDVFIKSKSEWESITTSMFGEPDFKKFLENRFHLEL